jgi:hypothetical protein
MRQPRNKDLPFPSRPPLLTHGSLGMSRLRRETRVLLQDGRELRGLGGMEKGLDSPQQHSSFWTDICDGRWGGDCVHQKTPSSMQQKDYCFDRTTS